ncbi:hypothetical protein [Saccharopolyspora rosea]|uniref:hypothetical protein n=1 Tax=Saccharopolyspora rosea TaxID=524884 RepID=UPI0021DB133F|nr:hypothetical protein [Saccharopolyspora rosea]
MIEWFSSVKDVAPWVAVLISVIAAMIAWRQYRMARQRDREQHAAKVAIWLEDDGPRYVNTSGLPIWAVSVEFDGRSERAERGCWPPAPQPIDARPLLGTNAENLLRDAIRDALARRDRVRGTAEAEEWTPLRFRSSAPRAITFTDGDNRRWRRDLNGVLTEIRRKRRS